MDSIIWFGFGEISWSNQWNTNVFGHLKKRKARILSRIDGIQRALRLEPNRFLNQFEVALVEEFNTLLDQEAICRHQKSRIKWLQAGDRNTKFFHLSTIIRRRRNKIERLKNEHGEWVEEASAIKDLVVSIDSIDLNHLNKSIDIMDVKESLFSIGSLKALGVDGFPAPFYQNHWSICDNEIVDLIRKAMEDCTVPTRLNDALIMLIPKVDSPSIYDAI
ncbi:hypothetical protein L3X38_034933 [Prunus dulcis]|uniref:Uncharacterized protein n=1 Tax=Prunus dulcis TaxID=3755 RepID=A0AAD4VIR7_PRUDU|nr:hypothetical protein L3X38_034933 [Prunus dulcis]